MVVLVVSSAPGLAPALAASLDVTGVNPADLRTWLADGPRLDGAIIDDADGREGALRSAADVRGHDPTCPLLVLVSAGVSPDHASMDSLAPARLIRRPFTAAHLISELRALGMGPAEDPVVPTADVRPESHPRVSGTDRPGWRRRRGREDAAAGKPVRSPDLTVAIETLLDAEELPDVATVSQEMMNALAEHVGGEAGIALLIAHDDGWRVTSGQLLSINERRAVIPYTHWLARRVTGSDTAVIVSGTDVARQELQSVPLIHHDQWMATTTPGAPALVVVARSEGAFSVTDASDLRAVVAPLVGRLQEALLMRELARRIGQTTV